MKSNRSRVQRSVLSTLLLAFLSLLPFASAQAAAPIQATPAATGTVNIEIKDYKFNPATIKIAVGTKVVWTNNDGPSHTVTSDTAGQFGSDLIKPGATFEFTFTKAGTFAYHCQPHPFMKAQIVVEEAAAQPAASATTAAAAAGYGAPGTTAASTPVPATMVMPAASTPATSTVSSTDSTQLAFLIVGVALLFAAIAGGYFLGRAGNGAKKG